MKPVRALAAVVAAGALSLCACSVSSSSNSTQSVGAATRAWAAGGGKAALTLVDSDLATISDDSQNMQAASLPADGQALTRDAIAASGNPMPCDRADYAAAMASLAAAGTDLAIGEVDQASAAIDAADIPLLRAVTAYNQALATPS